jgi:hypothetical protein
MSSPNGWKQNQMWAAMGPGQVDRTCPSALWPPPLTHASAADQELLLGQGAAVPGRRGRAAGNKPEKRVMASAMATGGSATSNRSWNLNDCPIKSMHLKTI